MIFPKDVLSGETNKDLEGDRLTVAKAACPPQTPPLGHAADWGSFLFMKITKLQFAEILKLSILICIPCYQSRQAKPIDLYSLHIGLAEGGQQTTPVIDLPPVAMYSKGTVRR